MIFNIVKKDFILAKRYLLLVFIFAIVGPFFIESKAGFVGGGFISFFITAFFIQYMLFSSISMAEYKYKGSIHLCVTPYTRKLIVKGTYLFILTGFILSTFIYIALASLTPINIPIINISVDLPFPATWIVGTSFLVIAIYFSIIIPLQYKFGYEKTKYMLSSFIFVFPFILPRLVVAIEARNIKLVPNSPYLNLLPYILAMLIGMTSILITEKVYSQKDLQ